MASSSFNAERVIPPFSEGQEPIVVITGDQDWAPEWAMEQTVSFVRNHDFPYHLFRTNPSPAFDAGLATSELFSQGWHPNFLPASTHGTNPTEVINYMSDLFPNSRSVRCHSYVESSHIWRALSSHSILVDSNGLTDLEPYLWPIKMWTGLFRMHVFLEDDCFFSRLNNEPEIRRLRSNILLPGLKILNFHPIHIALNTASDDEYIRARECLARGDQPEQNQLFGSRTLLTEILELCRENQVEIWRFESLIDAVCGYDQNKREEENHGND